MLRRVTMRVGVGVACAIAAVMCAVPAALGAPAAPPFRPLDPAALAREKQQAEAGNVLRSPLRALDTPPSPSPQAAVAPSATAGQTLNQPGMSSTDNSSQGTPPDPTGAVGPSRYIEFVNNKVGVYLKSTLAQVGSLTDLDTFIGATGDFVFDPQIQWDPNAGRWFYAADDCTDGGPCVTGNRIAFGFSKTADPADGWCPYFIDTGTLFDDYPKLGHNNTHLLIGTNVFDATGAFVSARIWTIDKPASGAITTCPLTATLGKHFWSGSPPSFVKDDPSFATGGAPLKYSATGNPVFTPVPANTQDSSANGYIVAADDPSPTASTILTFHVDASGTLVSDQGIAVTSFSVPANVPQPGTADRLDSSDTRLTQAVAITDTDAGAEAVWTQHTVNGPGGRSVVRWYELLPATRVRRQEGTVSNASLFVFNGAISPTGAGNEAVVQYNVGGSSAAAQIRAASRRPQMTLGTMGGEVTLASNSNIDQDFSCPSEDPMASSCRWGDYAGATPDPSDPHVVWGTNQLNGTPSVADPRWITRNFALLTSVAPVASFSSAAPNPSFARKTVSFNGAASSDPDGGSIASYAWDFGDGASAAGVTATHAYSEPGTYTATLTVTDSDDALSSSTSQQVTVNSAAPTAAFVATPSTVARGQAVSFDGSGSADAEHAGGIAAWGWDFDGDGSIDETTSTPTTTHSYASLGTFNVRLTVVDADDGLTSAASTHPVTIVNTPPTARLTASAAAPQTGARVSFSAAGSSDETGIADYRWDLDGNGVFETDTGTTPSVTHVYSAAGKVQVGLLVQDTDGATSTASTAVTVTRPFTVRLSGARKLRLATLLRRGASVRVACSQPCSAKLTLTIPATLARNSKLRRVIGVKTLPLTGKSTRTTQISLTRSARKRLANARPFSLRLAVSARDASRRTVTAGRSLRIAR